MKKIFNIIEIINDLKDLEKKVYLDTPEFFVDFADRIEDNNLDEMVLFFATKYDYLSIIKFILNNNIINLDSPSKNKDFANIRQHILAAAVQFNAKDIYEYIINFNNKVENDNEEDNIETFFKTVGEKISDLCNQIDSNYDYSNETKEEIHEDNQKVTNDENILSEENTTNCKSENKSTESQQANIYEPKFICPNCSCNIFESGYSILENVTYKYSKDEKALISTSKEQENIITCLKCGYKIEQLNPAFLENICTVQNCKNCGKDLTSAGIVTKMKTEYDSESNSFITSKKSYHCAECDSELTDYQINYFKL